MTADPGVSGAAASLFASVEGTGAPGQAQGQVIWSEIVIVDDDGNEEPYDPAKH
ncbi:hypothetical protein ACFVSN_24515 [Kitasatospora sp. NPDC057904]|uniref:hypothetical protein n=1 Tax=unclassified Kitasatospora TaxID=2633591 RepID=UPI0036DCCD6D